MNNLYKIEFDSQTFNDVFRASNIVTLLRANYGSSGGYKQKCVERKTVVTFDLSEGKLNKEFYELFFNNETEFLYFVIQRSDNPDKYLKRLSFKVTGDLEKKDFEENSVMAPLFSVDAIDKALRNEDDGHILDTFKFLEEAYSGRYAVFYEDALANHRGAWVALKLTPTEMEELEKLYMFLMFSDEENSLTYMIGEAIRRHKTMEQAIEENMIYE